jgi:hypothetical protein
MRADGSDGDDDHDNSRTGEANHGRERGLFSGMRQWPNSPHSTGPFTVAIGLAGDEITPKEAATVT